MPSAIERYAKEVNRVLGVLEGYLTRQKREHRGSAGSHGPWLVGNKLSYADIVFIPWQKIVGVVLKKDEYNEDNYPHIEEWLGRMTSRETVKTVLESAFKA